MENRIRGLAARTIRGTLHVVALVTFSILMCVGYARAQIANDVYQLSDWDTTVGDGSVRIANQNFSGVPGSNGVGKICAMIYVFDANEQMEECCGCPVTHDGLRVLSTINDLTNNPVSQPNSNNPFKNGLIKIVSATTNSGSNNNKCKPGTGVNNCFGGPTFDCNPAILDPDGDNNVPSLRSWTTHVYTDLSFVGTQISETEFEDAPLSVGPTVSGNFQNNDSELQTLVAQCGYIHTSGSYNGICSCGAGDNTPLGPKAPPPRRQASPKRRGRR